MHRWQWVIVLAAIAVLPISCAKKEKSETEKLMEEVGYRTEILGKVGKYEVSSQYMGLITNTPMSYILSDGETAIRIADSIWSLTSPGISIFPANGLNAKDLSMVNVSCGLSLPKGTPPLEYSKLPEDIATEAFKIVSKAKEIASYKPELTEYLPDDLLSDIDRAAMGQGVFGQHSGGMRILTKQMMYAGDLCVVKLMASCISTEDPQIGRNVPVYLWDGGFAAGSGIDKPNVVVSYDGRQLLGTPAKGTGTRELKKTARSDMLGHIGLLIEFVECGEIQLEEAEIERLRQAIAVLQSDAMIRWQKPAKMDEFQDARFLEILWQ